MNILSCTVYFTVLNCTALYCTVNCLAEYVKLFRVLFGTAQEDKRESPGSNVSST